MCTSQKVWKYLNSGKLFTDNKFQVVCFSIQLFRCLILVLFLIKKRAVDGRAQTGSYYANNQVFAEIDNIKTSQVPCSNIVKDAVMFLPGKCPPQKGAALSKVLPLPQGQSISYDQPFLFIRTTLTGFLLPESFPIKSVEASAVTVLWFNFST